MTDKPTFSTSSCARAIVRIFAATKPGDFVSYAKLSKAIDRNVQTEARHVLEAARRALQREHNIVLGVVRNQGLRHLADDEAIESGHSSAEHIRRTAKQAAKRIVSLKNPEGFRGASALNNSFCSASSGFTRTLRTRRIRNVLKLR